jgi:hypothetical protein
MLLDDSSESTGVGVPTGFPSYMTVVQPNSSGA